MWVQVLGPLAVHGTRGGEVPIRRPGHRQLLCRLAVDVGRSVTTDRLVTDLWGEEPPRAARKSVQVYVSEIRRLLADDRGVLDSGAGGYRLVLDPVDVDAGRFEQEVADGTRALVDTPDRAAALLRDALSLWRGPALVDVGDLHWGQAAATHLEAVRLTALEHRVEADLVLGRHGAVTAELVELVAAHPLREGLRGQLMVALYRSGRQAEALQTHREGVAVLAEELGVDASPALTGLERRVLQQDPTLLTGPTGQIGGADHTGPRTGATAARDRPQAHVEAASLDVDATTERRWVTVLALVVPALGPTDRHATDPAEVLTDLGATLIQDTTAQDTTAQDTTAQDTTARGTTAQDPATRRPLGMGTPGRLLVAVLGAPVAHGDELPRAVEAIRRLRAFDGASRGAVTCGDVEVGVDGPVGARRLVASGPCLDEARRLLDGGPDGVIRLSPEASRAASGLPGVLVERDAGIPALRITADMTPSSATRFVGRRSELALLTALWAICRDQDMPHLVTVLGEAGVGKSRLVAEWTTHHADGVTVVTGRSTAWGEGPFGAVVQLLQQLIEPPVPEEDEDWSDTVAMSVRRWLRDHGMAEDDAVARHLGLLLGDTDPAVDVTDHREVYVAVEAVLVAAARAQPTVVVLEDVHLSGRSVAELIGWLAATDRRVPLLLLVTARPELNDRHPDWHRMTGRTTTIALEELDPTAAAALAADVADDLPLRAEAPTDTAFDTRRDQLVAWLQVVAGGNPLFLEQLGAWLADASDAPQHRVAELPGPPSAEDPERTLPPTIRSLLAMRLDQLGGRPRRVLQSAAVIGQTFDVDAVALLLAPDRVGATLDRLVDRRVLVALPGGRRYAFRHALLSEVVLASIPPQRRRALHRRLAESLDRRPRSPDVRSQLAHHWLAAGDAERALPHLVAAAAEAARAWAHHDAVGLYTRALELLEATDPDHRDEALLRDLTLRRATAAIKWMHRVLDWYLWDDRPGSGASGRDV